MSMNMLPMQFDRQIGLPSRLQELIAKTSASRKVRYGISVGLVLFVVCLYFVAAWSTEGSAASPSTNWTNKKPSEDIGQDASPVQPPTRFQRTERVKNAFMRAYSVYEKNAFPHDELLPLSNGYQDNFNGWGVSLIDSLDTMFLMNLDNVTDQTISHVAKLTFDQNQDVQFFETVIRYLGGLLSAYSMTGNLLYLSRADDVGRTLLPAFSTRSGFPSFKVNVKTGKTVNGWAGNNAILSEIASCQMEYRLLAHLTGRPEYVLVVDRITEHLRETTQSGLFSLTFDLDNGAPNGDIYSAGARADSTYEYLLKLWLMTGKTEQKFLGMYIKSADAIIDHLLFISPNRKLLYATDVWANSLQPLGNFQHLTCFLAGLLALGAATIPNIDLKHAWAAEGLAHSCWISYADSTTGLGPEVMNFRGEHMGRRWVNDVKAWEDAGRPGGVPPGVNQTKPVAAGEDTEYIISDSMYKLRPETVESFYILWRTTGDPKWQERGWAIFEAIEKHAAVGDAFATVLNVNTVPTPKKDEMPSYFLAETLKYLYLLLDEQDLLPLDKWTFNTEAHPFPVFTWAEWEKDVFGLNK